MELRQHAFANVPMADTKISDENIYHNLDVNKSPGPDDFFFFF